MAVSSQHFEPARGSVPPAADASLTEWLQWIEAARGEQIELGLERCRAVAERLKLPRPAPVVVTVAGTNGKGSSVAMLESIWRAAGYRVGTYTSPHLLRFNERIRVAGAPLEERAICQAFAAVEDVRGDVPLTYFEFATLAALHHLAGVELDLVILEVGLGGRLDAVNIIDADVSLIAAIGLDHEDWLGTTREAIAIEKAGIMRTSRPAVCSDHEAPETLLSESDRIGASLALLGVDFAFEPASRDWTWWSGATELRCLPYPGLDGAHQLRNASGVLKVIDILQPRLPVDFDAIAHGLSEVQLNGRFQRVKGSVEYVMDVAHNPQAAAIFAETLRTMPSAARTFVIAGMLNTKNHLEFLRPLTPLVDEWHFSDLSCANGARAAELARCLKSLDRAQTPHVHEDILAAHHAVVERAGEGDRVLVIGSFVTVGAVMAILRNLG